MKWFRRAQSCPLGLFCALCCTLAPGLWPTAARGESGLEVSEIAPTAATSPPPHQEMVSNYSITITNTNDVCDEEVTIANVGELINDYLDADLGELRRGKSEFLGFWDGASYVNPISYVVVDETSQNQIIGISTGEDDNGCDFQGFRLAIQFCDTGPKCWDCCDVFDIAPCEDPTPYQKTLQITAAALPPPPKDIGKIWGKVTKNGHGALAHISIRRSNLMAFCLKGEVDYDPAFGNGAWERDTEGGLSDFLDFGSYSEKEIPLGEFEVKARVDGAVSDPVTVTLKSGQTSAEVNFAF